MRVFPKGQGFTVGLLGALAFAWLWPEGGKAQGLLRADDTTKAAVVIIFLLQGLNLPLGQLQRGLGDWRLHLFVQLFVFFVFPFATWCLVETGILPGRWAPGFLFLAALPTTISTAIVYTSAAGGDPSRATFNATFSNLVGIFVVPAWCALFVFPLLAVPVSGASTEGFFAEFLAKLFGLILAPLCVGMVVRRFFGDDSEKRGPLLRNLSFYCVLFIAYTGFCQAFLGADSSVATQTWWAALAWAAVLLVWAKALAWFIPGWFGFAYEQRLAAFFCSSQKSLAVGLPMGQLLFGLEHPQLFVLLLPLILYHMLQLLVGGILVGRFSPSED